MVPTILVIVLITVVGISVLAYRNRAERGIESGISSFRRELRALAPENHDHAKPHRPVGDPPRTPGVGILRPDAPEPPDQPADGPTTDDAAGVDPPPDPEPGEGR